MSVQYQYGFMNESSVTMSSPERATFTDKLSGRI